MYLSVAALASLFALSQAASSTALPTDLVGLKNFFNTLPNDRVPTADNRFKLLKLFKEASNHEDFFSGLEYVGALNFALTVFDHPSWAAFRNSQWSDYDSKAAKDVFGVINAKYLKALTSSGPRTALSCGMLMRFLPHFGDRSEIPTLCRTALLDDAACRARVNVPMQVYTKIPADWVESEGDRVMSTLMAKSPEGLRYVSAEFWEALNSSENKNPCRHIEAKNLVFAKDRSDKRDFFGSLSPECFAQMSHPEGDFSEIVKYLPENFAKNVKVTLHKNVQNRLSEDQLGNFNQEAAEYSVVCNGVEFTNLKTGLIGKMPANCLYGMLNFNPKAVGKGWKYITLATIQEFKEDMAKVFEKIPLQHFQYMKSEVIQHILTTPETLEYVKNDIVLTPDNCKELKLTTEQYVLLAEKHGKIVSRLLMHSTAVPTTVFESFTDDLVKQLEYTTTTDKRYLKGFEVIVGMQRHSREETRKNIDQIMANFAAKVSVDDHPCKLITSSIQYSKLSAFRPYVTGTCIKAFSWEIKDHVEKFPELAIGAENWEEIMNKVDFAKVDAGTIGVLSKHEKFGDFLLENKAVFDKIPASAAAGLNPATIFKLRKFIEPEQAKRYSDIAFAKFGVAELAGYKFEDFTAAQLAHISEDVEVKNHFFTTVTAENIAGMTAETIAIIPAKAWSAVSAKHSSAFTSDVMAKVPADNLVLLTIEQVGGMPAKTLEELTPEQITKIGKDIPDFSLSTLEKHSGKYNEAQKAALKEREEANKSSASAETEESSSLWYYFLRVGLPVLAVLVIGGVVYFFFFK